MNYVFCTSKKFLFLKTTMDRELTSRHIARQMAPYLGGESPTFLSASTCLIQSFGLPGLTPVETNMKLLDSSPKSHLALYKTVDRLYVVWDFERLLDQGEEETLSLYQQTLAQPLQMPQLCYEGLATCICQWAYPLNLAQFQNTPWN